MKKVGTIVNTHGIKGELRILSGGRFSNNDFDEKYKTLFIQDTEYKVKSYRMHKKFHQIFLKGYDNINDVLFLKGHSVFVNQADDSIDIDSLVGTEVFLYGVQIGLVESISHTKLYKLLNLDTGKIVPLNENFIISIDKAKIEVKNI